MLVQIDKLGAFLIICCAGICSTQAARATDVNASLPAAPAPAQQQQQKPDWAGFYIRGNSAGSESLPWTTVAPAEGFAAPNAAGRSVNESFGYNFQSGNFVFGLEGSLAAANFDGRFTAPSFPAASAGGWTPNMNWFGTVSGRIGYSFGQWLPYVKGGFASADVGTPLQGAGQQLGAFSQGTPVNGWMTGVGLEYQINSKLSLGVEYLYTDLGNGNASGAPGTLGGAPITGSPEAYSTALKSQSFLGRLNFKPGW